jgi:hypothetical protein
MFFSSFETMALVMAYDLQEMKVVLSMEMMIQTIFELMEEGGGRLMNQNIMKISMPQIHRNFLKNSHQIGIGK